MRPVSYYVQLAALLAAVLSPPAIYLLAGYWHSTHIILITLYLWIVAFLAWAWNRQGERHL